MKKTKKVINSKINSTVSNDNEMSKLIILIIVVALIFGIFYVVTLFVTKKDDKESNSDNSNQSVEATIQYEKILAGNIFSQSNEEYYVLVYFGNDKYTDYYKSYLNYYSSKVEQSVPYYYVDMDDVFNKEFVSEESNIGTSDVKKIKFSQTALLRIKNGKIISSYEGHENISGKLGRMTK